MGGAYGKVNSKVPSIKKVHVCMGGAYNKVNSKVPSIKKVHVCMGGAYGKVNSKVPSIKKVHVCMGGAYFRPNSSSAQKFTVSTVNIHLSVLLSQPIKTTSQFNFRKCIFV